MIPNKLGKAGGLTANDGKRLNKRLEALDQSLNALRAFEEVTQQPCEGREDCERIVRQARELKDRFFGTLGDLEEK